MLQSWRNGSFLFAASAFRLLNLALQTGKTWISAIVPGYRGSPDP